MIIYCNGDSFVAGHDLGDDMLNGFPGYSPFQHNFIQHNWYMSSFNKNIRFGDGYEKVLKLEKERAFPGLLSSEYEYNVVNDAFPGASMDRIARTTISTLIQLKKKNTDLIAIIGTTDISRTEIPGTDSIWTSISPTINSINNTIDSLLRFKIEYEKDYHCLVNFYKNAILIQDFCTVNNIKLFWVHTMGGVITEIKTEHSYQAEADLESFKDYLKLEYILNMEIIAKEGKYQDALGPGGHYSPTMHKIFAKEINKIIKNNI